MSEIKGESLSEGIAMGRICFYSDNIVDVARYETDDAEREFERYIKALETAKSRLQKLYDYVKENIGEDESVIFQTHIMILEDSQFRKKVENNIKNCKMNAEFAVYDAALKIGELFKQIDDEYLKQRYCDIIDSANTMLEILDPQTKDLGDDTYSVIAAKWILPSETVKFRKNNFCGFVTNQGSRNCHSAILARSMELPAVTGIKGDLSEFNGVYTIIDGYQGKIIIEPDDATIAAYEKLRADKEMLKEKALKAVELLEKEYPEALCSLEYTDPLQLLIATRLAAQCTDERVNKVTPALFERYKNVHDFAEADVDEVGKYIYSCGFYKTKSRDIVAMCQMLIDEYNGTVPDTVEKLTKLPGIGRKTANLIVGDIYGKPAVVVDTHCIRITGRLGLHKIKDAAKIETILRGLLPPEKSNNFCHRLVLHGRAVCNSRKPKCSECCLKDICDYYASTAHES